MDLTSLSLFLLSPNVFWLWRTNDGNPCVDLFLMQCAVWLYRCTLEMKIALCCAEQNINIWKCARAVDSPKRQRNAVDECCLIKFEATKLNWIFSELERESSLGNVTPPWILNDLSALISRRSIDDDVTMTVACAFAIAIANGVDIKSALMRVCTGGTHANPLAEWRPKTNRMQEKWKVIKWKWPYNVR